jgi:hypothetical protein
MKVTKNKQTFNSDVVYSSQHCKQHCTVQLNKYTELYQSFIYSPTNELDCCLKKDIKIYIKTAPKCFGAVTPLLGSALIRAY